MFHGSFFWDCFPNKLLLDLSNDLVYNLWNGIADRQTKENKRNLAIFSCYNDVLHVVITYNILYFPIIM